MMTAALFEVWATQPELPPPLFHCPSTKEGADQVDATLRPSLERADTSWGWSHDHAVPYAFDYSAPFDSDKHRIIAADRSLGNHSGWVTVVMADTSTKKLHPAENSPATSTICEHTLTRTGPSDALVVNDELTDPIPDNIYDNVGDISGTMKPGDEFQVGTGSPRRAFVK